LAGRTIGTWEHRPEYKDKKGAVKPLSASGKGSDFFILVESVSKDINPYTLLFELERTGSIVWLDENHIALKKQEFIPKGSLDLGFEILSSDLEDLATAVDENIYGINPIPNLHLKTEYTNVRLSAVPEIRECW